VVKVVLSKWSVVCYNVKTRPIFGFRGGPPGRLILSSEDRGTPIYSLHGAVRNISATIFKHFYILWVVPPVF
jgi:hypothetical protein